MWLEEVYDRCAKKKTDYALDVVFEEIDKLLWENDWDAINNILEQVDLSKINGTTGYGFIVITYCEKDRLPYRPEFIAKVEQKFREEGKSRKQIEEIIGNKR